MNQCFYAERAQLAVAKKWTPKKTAREAPMLQTKENEKSRAE